MGFRYDEIRDFLYREARLLDDKAWDEWLTLYCEDVEYWMPAWDDDGQPTDNPNTELSLMYYARRDGLGEDDGQQTEDRQCQQGGAQHVAGQHLAPARITDR